DRARGAAPVSLRGPAAGARLRPARPVRAAAAAAHRQPGGGALDRARRLPADRGLLCLRVYRGGVDRLGPDRPDLLLLRHLGSAAALAYLAVVGTFTFLGTQWLIPRLPVAVVGTFPILNTLLALLWGSALGHERLTARAGAGGVLILLGVLLVTFRRRPGQRE